MFEYMVTIGFHFIAIGWNSRRITWTWMKFQINVNYSF